VVLIEMFIQTGSDPSKPAGQALERLAEEYGPSKIILLEYYLTADLYAKGAWDRADSYGVGGTPTVCFDGPQNMVKGKTSYKEYKAQVDSERAKTASLVITAQKSMSGEKWYATFLQDHLPFQVWLPARASPLALAPWIFLDQTCRR
jgi:hypothetical protein